MLLTLDFSRAFRFSGVPAQFANDEATRALQKCPIESDSSLH